MTIVTQNEETGDYEIRDSESWELIDSGIEDVYAAHSLAAMYEVDR